MSESDIELDYDDNLDPDGDITLLKNIETETKNY